MSTKISVVYNNCFNKPYKYDAQIGYKNNICLKKNLYNYFNTHCESGAQLCFT